MNYDCMATIFSIETSGSAAGRSRASTGITQLAQIKKKMAFSRRRAKEGNGESAVACRAGWPPPLLPCSITRDVQHSAAAPDTFADLTRPVCMYHPCRRLRHLYLADSEGAVFHRCLRGRGILLFVDAGTWRVALRARKIQSPTRSVF